MYLISFAKVDNSRRRVALYVVGLVQRVRQDTRAVNLPPLEVERLHFWLLCSRGLC